MPDSKWQHMQMANGDYSLLNSLNSTPRTSKKTAETNTQDAATTEKICDFQTSPNCDSLKTENPDEHSNPDIDSLNLYDSSQTELTDLLVTTDSGDTSGKVSSKISEASGKNALQERMADFSQNLTDPSPKVDAADTIVQLEVPSTDDMDIAEIDPISPTKEAVKRSISIRSSSSSKSPSLTSLPSASDSSSSSSSSSDDGLIDKIEDVIEKVADTLKETAVDLKHDLKGAYSHAKSKVKNVVASCANCTAKAPKRSSCSEGAEEEKNSGESSEPNICQVPLPGGPGARVAPLPVPELTVEAAGIEPRCGPYGMDEDVVAPTVQAETPADGQVPALQGILKKEDSARAPAKNLAEGEAQVKISLGEEPANDQTTLAEITGAEGGTE